MNNNYIISIPKDLKKIESKLFFGLTKRQLIGFSIGGGLGLLVFFTLRKVNLDLAMYGLFFSVAPMIFATIYKKDGMYVEKWIKLLIEQKYLNPSKRYYKVSKRNIKLAKERGLFIEKRIKNKNRKQRVAKNQSVSGTTNAIRQKPKKKK